MGWGDRKTANFDEHMPGIGYTGIGYYWVSKIKLNIFEIEGSFRFRYIRESTTKLEAAAFSLVLYRTAYRAIPGLAH